MMTRRKVDRSLASQVGSLQCVNCFGTFVGVICEQSVAIVTRDRSPKCITFFSGSVGGMTPANGVEYVDGHVKGEAVTIFTTRRLAKIQHTSEHAANPQQKHRRKVISRLGSLVLSLFELKKLIAQSRLMSIVRRRSPCMQICRHRHNVRVRVTHRTTVCQERGFTQLPGHNTWLNRKKFSPADESFLFEGLMLSFVFKTVSCW